MELRDLEKYIGKVVFFTLKNGFRYKILLKEEYIDGQILKFEDKYGSFVSIDVDEINFMVCYKENA